MQKLEKFIETQMTEINQYILEEQFEPQKTKNAALKTIREGDKRRSYLLDIYKNAQNQQEVVEEVVGIERTKFIAETQILQAEQDLMVVEMTRKMEMRIFGRKLLEMLTKEKFNGLTLEDINILRGVGVREGGKVIIHEVAMKLQDLSTELYNTIMLVLKKRKIQLQEKK